MVETGLEGPFSTYIQAHPIATQLEFGNASTDLEGELHIHTVKDAD